MQVIEAQRLEPAVDLSGAMVDAIERLATDGWQIEAEPRFGFAFIRRASERRLLMLTPRDPHDHRRNHSARSSRVNRWPSPLTRSRTFGDVASFVSLTSAQNGREQVAGAT